jgi:hypothetical protein
VLGCSIPACSCADGCRLVGTPVLAAGETGVLQLDVERTRLEEARGDRLELALALEAGGVARVLPLGLIAPRQPQPTAARCLPAVLDLRGGEAQTAKLRVLLPAGARITRMTFDPGLTWQVGSIDVVRLDRELACALTIDVARVQSDAEARPPRGGQTVIETSAGTLSVPVIYR